MFKTKFNPARRHLVYLDPYVLRIMIEERNGWHESAADVRAGLRWGKRKAFLLQWVRQRMTEILTEREQQCIDLYFFHGKSFHTVGQLTGTNASSAYRAVKRAVRKLRAAAIEAGLVRGSRRSAARRKNDTGRA